MAMNLGEVKTSATEAVLIALTQLYKESDKEGMRAFAEAIAEAAVVAVAHVQSNARTELSGEGLD